MIPPLLSTPPASAQPLRNAAELIETQFISEMLKHSGLGATQDSQFTSFLHQAQAEQMAKAGGFNLAETLFESLKERTYD